VRLNKLPLTTMEHLSILVVVVASIKFLFQGGTVTLFGAADASTYAMFLAPVLGTHGYIHSKKKEEVVNVDPK
jgi:hypothetical protein